MKHHYKLFAYCIISSLTTANAFGSELLTIWYRNREIRKSRLSECFLQSLREAQKQQSLASQTEDPDQKALHLAAAEREREGATVCRDEYYRLW
jgi:hypothetical protein